jgi:hypothetical protein
VVCGVPLGSDWLRKREAKVKAVKRAGKEARKNDLIYDHVDTMNAPAS